MTVETGNASAYGPLGLYAGRHPPWDGRETRTASVGVSHQRVNGTAFGDGVYPDPDWALILKTFAGPLKMMGMHPGGIA